MDFSPLVNSPICFLFRSSLDPENARLTFESGIGEVEPGKFPDLCARIRHQQREVSFIGKNCLIRGKRGLDKMKVLAEIVPPRFVFETGARAIEELSEFHPFPPLDSLSCRHRFPPAARGKRCVLTPLHKKPFTEDCNMAAIADCVQAFAAVVRDRDVGSASGLCNVRIDHKAHAAPLLAISFDSTASR